MSLGTCPECNGRLSSTAESCPTCGYIPRAWKKRLVKFLLVVIAGVFGFLQLGTLPIGQDPISTIAFQTLIVFVVALGIAIQL